MKGHRLHTDRQTYAFTFTPRNVRRQKIIDWMLSSSSTSILFMYVGNGTKLFYNFQTWQRNPYRYVHYTHTNFPRNFYSLKRPNRKGGWRGSRSLEEEKQHCRFPISQVHNTMRFGRPPRKQSQAYHLFITLNIWIVPMFQLAWESRQTLVRKILKCNISLASFLFIYISATNLSVRVPFTIQPTLLNVCACFS